MRYAVSSHFAGGAGVWPGTVLPVEQETARGLFFHRQIAAGAGSHHCGPVRLFAVLAPVRKKARRGVDNFCFRDRIIEQYLYGSGEKESVSAAQSERGRVQAPREMRALGPFAGSFAEKIGAARDDRAVG